MCRTMLFVGASSLKATNGLTFLSFRLLHSCHWSPIHWSRDFGVELNILMRSAWCDCMLFTFSILMAFFFFFF